MRNAERARISGNGLRNRVLYNVTKSETTPTLNSKKVLLYNANDSLKSVASVLNAVFVMRPIFGGLNLSTRPEAKVWRRRKRPNMRERINRVAVRPPPENNPSFDL